MNILKPFHSHCWSALQSTTLTSPPVSSGERATFLTPSVLGFYQYLPSLLVCLTWQSVSGPSLEVSGTEVALIGQCHQDNQIRARGITPGWKENLVCAANFQ